MKAFLKITAYFCIATTPIQIFIVVWGIQIVFSSDYDTLSLSNIEFIKNYLNGKLMIIQMQKKLEDKQLAYLYPHP